MEDKTKDMMDLFAKAKNAPVNYPVKKISVLVGGVGAVGAASGASSFFNLSNIAIMVGSVFTVVTAAVVINAGGTEVEQNIQAPIETKKEIVLKENALAEIPTRVLVEENELKSVLPIENEPEVLPEIIEPEVIIPEEIQENEPLMFVAQPTNNIKGLPDFHSVHLNIAADVKIVQGSSPGISFENYPEMEDILDIRVTKGVLYIGVKKDRKRDYEKSSEKDKLSLVLTMNEVQNLVVNGSGDIYSNDNISTDNLTVEVNGSGDVELKKMVPNQLEVNVNGSGDVSLYGNGNLSKGMININGSGDVCVKSMDIVTLAVNINGSGDASVACDGELSVNILGSGDVCYSGNAKVKTKRLGSGEVVNCGNN